MHHAQADQRPGHPCVVARIAAQAGEGAHGVVVVALVHLGAAQLVERLLIEGHARRGVLDVQQRGYLAALVAGQAIGHRLLVVGIDIVGGEELRQHLLIRGDGGFVVPAAEVAVRAAVHRVLAHRRVARGDVAVKPARGVGVVARLEIAVADVVRQQAAFRQAVQRGRVVQLGEQFLRLTVIARAVVRLAHPVAGQLVEAVRPGDIVGRGPEERDGVAVGAVREELLAPQEVRLRVVVLHVRRQLLDVVVGLHRAGVVLVHQSRQGHVAVDHVAAGPGGPALDVAGEAGGVLVQVEGQLGVVERGVLGDLRIEVHPGRVVERLHRRHLVVRAQVGVGHQVVGHLAQGIRAVAHLREIVDGSGVIVHGIEHRAGVEVILAVHVLVGQVVVVFAGLLLLALDQVRLGEHARHAFAALRGQAVVDARSFPDHEVVVLLVELAVHDVEIGQGLETRVGRSQPEIGLRLGELLVLIEHDTGEIVPRRRIVRLRERLQQGEEALCLGVLPEAERAESALEDIFGHLLIREVFRSHERELRGRLLILLPVEQNTALLEMQDTRQARRRVAQAVVRQQVVAVRRLHLQGAQHFVAVAQRVVRHRLEEEAGLFVHPVLIQAHRLPPGARATGGSSGRRGRFGGKDRQREQRGHQ